MEKSKNYNFNLPNSANDEIADINDISDNFRIIDEIMPATDQTYSPTSKNAQSGLAVAEAVAPKADKTEVDQIKSDLNAIVYNNDLDSLDHSKTYLYYHMTQGQFDFRPTFNALVGVTEIDWGDGSKTTVFIPEDNLKHIYTEAGDYIITIHGITSIKNTGFHAQTKLYKAVLADTVSSIGTSCFSENDANMEVYLFSEHFPTITNINAFKSCKKLYCKSDRYINYRNDLMDMLGIDTVFNRVMYGTLAEKLYPIDENKIIYTDKIVTVGENGDFKSLNEALEVLSQFYPVYKKDFYGSESSKKGQAKWGVNCEIRILAGTVINEQVFVKQMDLQWITITAEADSDHTETVTIDGTSHTVAIVDVDATGFTYTADAHDSRGNYPFMACENAGKFPTIGCLFRLLPDTVETGRSICGLLCNRGSEGVVLAGSGFDGFYDGVIANNESSITIREGISRNMTRWGVHARHNGEVSARSCVCTNCGIGACADRVADLDVREAVLDGSTVAIECNNISRVNANGCHANNCGSSSDYIVKVSGGGFANCGSLETTGAKGNVFSQDSNTLTANGIIFA